MSKLRIGCRHFKAICLPLQLCDCDTALSVFQHRRFASPISHNHNRAFVMRDAKPWSRLWVATGDGCDRCGRVGSSHNKKRLFYAGKSPPTLHDITRKVFYVAIKISKIHPRYQGPRPASRLKQFPCAICNLQQSSSTGWGMAGIRAPRNPRRHAGN